MNKFIFSMAFIIGFFPQISIAAKSDSLCFCEIGNWPKSQEAIFVAGCETWLLAQKNCSVKKIVEQNHDYIAHANLGQHTQQVRLAYTGHWADSEETVQYLNQSVRPILAEGHSVRVENTACFAMNQADLILDYVKSLNLPKAQVLDVVGNQAESAGEWNLFLGRSTNFTAEVISTKDQVIYPSCKYYEEKTCYQQFQAGQSGYCVESNGSLQKLSCCKTPGTHSEVQEEGLFFAWQPASQCH